MASTALPMTTSLLGYNTTDNSTWPVSRGNQSDQTYEKAPHEILELQARYIPIIIVSVPAHMGIIVIILSSKSLRARAFFLGVLSMSIFDLCFCMFALPMNMDHYINWGKWRHGNIVCLLYTVIIHSKIYISSLMSIVLCAERLLAKLQSVDVIGAKMASTISRVVLMLPWCIGVLGGVLIVLIKQDEMTRHQRLHEQYCVLMVEETFHIPYLVATNLVPLGLLVLMPIAMAIVYKYKTSDWNRLSAEAVDPEAVSLYMSTVCVWIVSYTYVVLCVPVTVTFARIVMCIHLRRYADCPDWKTFMNTLTVSLLPSVVTPFLWIITVEIRAVLSPFKARLMKMVTPTDGQRSVLSFSSLRHKMALDDTGIGH